VENAGLRGHGGASFPMARKMQAVTSRRGRPIVVANGSEGEPASKKDRALLREVPHLVLDGAAVAARAVGARDAIVVIAGEDGRGARSLHRALGDRASSGFDDDPRFELFEIAPRYIAGQETALVAALNGRPAKPTFAPPLPFERGVRGRPTLVQNVETLAHLALIARHGAGWFRELGTPTDPGSALVTVSGAVAAPGVYEVEQGMPLSDLLEVTRLTDGLAGVLVGGYFGTWLSPDVADEVRLSGDHLREYGAALGAGVIVVLGAAACPVAETARIADWFAAESARQCGPCVNGLDAIAATIHQVATGTASRSAWSDLERWARNMRRRGACQHPDGAIRFIGSALRAFEPELRDHARRGPCERCGGPPVLPAPIRARLRG
jgi:NADH:ubiquinone oxidoreductase subunit F (NADH-binding)